MHNYMLKSSEDIRYNLGGQLIMTGSRFSGCYAGGIFWSHGVMN